MLQLWEEDEVVLCAVTAGIRTNWVQAIRQAVLNRATCDQNAAADMAPSPSIAVATESGGTKSQGTQETSSSDDHSEYFSVVDEDEEDTLDSRTLPPSPPLNRTAISRWVSALRLWLSFGQMRGYHFHLWDEVSWRCAELEGPLAYNKPTSFSMPRKIIFDIGQVGCYGVM